MSWYVAKSLDVLLVQLNAKAPDRSKVSDGSIGDASHSARESDHNPTSTGQVCARDFTNDPAGGLAGQWLADALVASRDPRIKYVIFNHRIIDSRAGNNPWRWTPYSGINAHEHHVHVSVFAGALGDQTTPWNLGGAGEDDEMGDRQNKQLDKIHEQLMGTKDPDAGWPGFPSFKYPDHAATPVDFIRHIDENLINLAGAVTALAKDVAALKATPPK